MQHTILDQETYDEKLADLLKRREDSNNAGQHIYSDSKGVPTLGIGYALTNDKGVARKMQEIKSHMKETLSPEKYQAIDWHELDTFLNKHLNHLSNSHLSNHQKHVKTRDAIATYKDNAGNHELHLTTDEEKALLSKTLPEFEKSLDHHLGKDAHTLLPLSEERIAVISQQYRLGSRGTPSLLTAIKEENRAEAWYEIRYNSNFDKEPGNASRVVEESNLFKLYDKTPSHKAMQDIIDMETKHHDKIIEEENRWPDIYKGDESIEHQIEAAKSYMQEHTQAEPYIQTDPNYPDHVQIDLSQANPITLVQLMHALPKETLNQAQVLLKENDAIAISKKEELTIEKGDTFQDVQTHSQLSTAALIAKNPWLAEKGRIHLPEETMVSTHVSNLSIKDQMYYENQENQKAPDLTQEQTQEDVQTYGLVKEETARDELTLANKAETSQAFSMDTVDYNKYLPEHLREENMNDNDATYSNEGGMDIA